MAQSVVVDPFYTSALKNPKGWKCQSLEIEKIGRVFTSVEIFPNFNWKLSIDIRLLLRDFYEK